MKQSITLSSLLFLSLFAHAQTDAPQGLEAYFSATIVNEIDTSIDWYTSVLGFELISKVESEERGFKQANLKRGVILIELIELNSAVSAAEVVPDYTNKTRMHGFFKIGFTISNFPQWMDHLKSKKADFYGNLVTDESGKRIAIILDPDGNRVQLFEK